MTSNKLALTVGAIALSFTAATFAASENPFAAKSLTKGYQVADNHAKDKEGKCGEGKCGAEKKTAGEKDKEGKCGEGKCGADKKAAGEKAKEGKCGEGKCGH
jgi:uncharacterized low-complexity protein